MSQKNIAKFIQTSLPSYWRGIILFGSNRATYKFALGKALLELAQQETTFVKLEDLAVPYSSYLIEHLKTGNRQGTSKSSKFLEMLQAYIEGRASRAQMLDCTVKKGFRYVIGAFHNISGVEVPRFYINERKGSKGIRITDELFQLLRNQQASNLGQETEARWKLVEAAWTMNISPSLLVVQYDSNGQIFFSEHRDLRRIDLTSARDALNGYQKGKCFYCFRDIHIHDSSVHVDHVFPHMLKPILRERNNYINLDGVWNLVLACQDCNLSKSAQRPDYRYIERLSRRNEFLITSHHPLKETLINQTGSTPNKRRQFLKDLYRQIGELGKLESWSTAEQGEPAF